MNILKGYKDEKKALLIVLIIFCLRIFFLDADFKVPWGVLNYQPIDEGGYANLALSVQNFGVLNPNEYYDDKYIYDIAPHSINNIVGNIATIISMKIFGDNYWGLRMGTVFSAALIVVLFYIFLTKIFFEEKYKMLNLLITILLSNCFVFYNASRIVEPSIFRMLFLQIILLLFVSNINVKIKYTLIGFFAVSSVFLVYITNVFVILGLFLFWCCLLKKKDIEQAKTLFVYSFCGGGSAYALSFLYYYLIWGKTPIINALDAINVYSNVEGYEITLGDSFFIGIIIKIFHGLVAFFSSNVFIYFPLLLASFVFALFFFKNISIKYGSIFDLCVCFALAFLVQTIVSEDYVVRKSIVLIPILFFIAEAVYSMQLENYAFSLQDGVKLGVYIILTIEMMIISVIYRLYLINDRTNYDFSSKDRLLLYLLLVVSCFVLLMYVAYLINTIIDFRGLLKIGVIALFSFNILFIFKYDYKNITYAAKENMIDIGKYTNDKIVCMQYENSISLYNDMLPLVCERDYISDYMRKDENVLLYAYDSLKDESKGEDDISGNIEVVKTFPANFKTFGEVREWSLFRYKIFKHSD